MKVAQNGETNPNTQSICLRHIPSIANIKPFPLGSFVRKCLTSRKRSRMLSPFDSSARKHETPGIFSRMFPPFTGVTSYRVRTHLALPVVLLCTCLLCIYCFFPPLLSGRPRDCRWCRCDQLRRRRPLSLLPEQPGKPPPLITRYRLFYSILLVLE